MFSGSKQKYDQYFGDNTVSGTAFVIDMSQRQLYLYNSGDLSHTITSAKSNSITDNVYRAAKSGDYGRCASEAFRQVYTVLDGGKIAEPMKIICNAFMAILVGLILAYGVVKIFSATPKPSEKELLAAIQSQQMLDNYIKQFTHQTRRYDPPSSSSSGGGGGGSSSGGGHGF